jgi:DNA-binding MarR family transcriptional regulator
MAAGQDIPMGLRQAYLSMHRQTNAHLSQCGVTADQFVLMFLLSQEDGITQQELTRRACSDPNTIRAMLVLLEDRGLVSRQQHPTDGRALRVTLTRKGRQVLERSMRETEIVRDQLVAVFTAEETVSLAGFLRSISDSMSQLNLCNTQSRSGQMRATGRKSKSFLKGEVR